MNSLTDLSPALLAAIGALIALQLALQVAALVNLARTPSSGVTLGGRKWLWVIVIVAGEIIGPIVYFAAGRLPAPALERPVVASASGRADAAADALYGATPSQPKTSPEASALAGEEELTPASAAEVGADGTGMGELP